MTTRKAASKKKSPKQRKVSLWLAVKKPSVKNMQGVDILKDLCGLRHYDLDSQELSAVADNFFKASVEQILGKLSYCSTFIDAATQAAVEIKHSYWLGMSKRPEPGAGKGDRATVNNRTALSG